MNVLLVNQDIILQNSQVFVILVQQDSMLCEGPQSARNVMLEVFRMPRLVIVNYAWADITQVQVWGNVVVVNRVNMLTQDQQDATYVQRVPFPTQLLLLVRRVLMGCILILGVQNVLVVLMPTTDGYRALVSPILLLHSRFGPKFNFYATVMP